LIARNALRRAFADALSMQGTPRPPFRNVWTLESLSQGDVSDLLGVAVRLERWPGAQTAARPLAGRNLAVIGCDAANAPIGFVRDAAGELGARVAHLRGDVAFAGEPVRAARLLGRLYDAIDCEGLDTTILREIDREAGVPVFDGLYGAAQTVAALIELDQRIGGDRSGARVLYVGSRWSARCTALLRAAALAGIDVQVSPGPAERSDARLTLDDRAPPTGPRTRQCALQAVLLHALVAAPRAVLR
jgi:ornithine carbamoyltransferase